MGIDSQGTILRLYVSRPNLHKPGEFFQYSGNKRLSSLIYVLLNLYCLNTLTYNGGY